MESVDAIEGVETGAQDRPVEPVVIERVEVSDRAHPAEPGASRDDEG
jgi:hypothetical protein